MAAVVEQSIHTLSIADLARLSFLICNLPIRDSLTPLLAFLVATHVFVACSLLDEGAMTVLLVVGPAAGVSVAVRVCAGTISVFLASGSGSCQEGSGVGMAGGGDVGAEAGVEAFEEIAGVVV